METSDLRAMRCAPCEGGIAPLSSSEVHQRLEALHSAWTVTREQKAIEREIGFKDFAEALAFVNRVGALAEEHGHHPDIFLHRWNQVRLTLSTHAIEGLSQNDFILAAQIDALAEPTVEA